MFKIIDKLDSLTGWTTSDITKIKIHGINEIGKYIANENNSSLVIHTLANGINSYVEKTINPAIDISEYDEIVLWVYSTKLSGSGNKLTKLSDMKYKIDFNNTMNDFCIPLYETFTPIVFDVRDITTINRVRITALHNQEDYIVISSIVAYKDDIPLDIYNALKTKIENVRDSKLNNIKIGTLTGKTNDTEIKITGLKSYISKYTAIKIKDLTNEEIHQLDNNDESYYKMNKMYSGNKLLHDYANADVYLYYPIEYGLNKEFIIPSVNIRGWNYDVINRHTKQSKTLYSYTENKTVRERKNPEILNWKIEFHIESRSEYILQLLSDCVRNVIESEIIWINGKRYEINIEGSPVIIDPVIPEDLIYKKVYTCVIEIQEYYDSGVLLPETINITENINIMEE